MSSEGEELVGSVRPRPTPPGVAAIDFTLPSPLAPGGRLGDRHGSARQHVGVLADDPAHDHPRVGSRPRAAARVTLSGQLLEAGATVAVGGVARLERGRHAALHDHREHAGVRPGTAHDVVVTNPGGVSGTLRNGYIADFLDVPAGNQFHDDVVKLVASRVTAGSAAGSTASTTREAAGDGGLRLKAEHGICYTPPPCTPGIFADVPCPSTFADWIEAMSAEGITGGCGGGNFCPQDSVRRDQMAPFLLKAVHGPTYTPPLARASSGRPLPLPLRRLDRAAVPRT